ncbi:hypothetical protein [uncultured Propionivibrio sp.]|uniref:hypothetical protein n=1 Tax=uncultured Propionivibrio sp. TaxID=426737 RepID=UPI0029C0ABC1|nr:hypothetical protein [uncultured Propionivibrio sp.]
MPIMPLRNWPNIEIALIVLSVLILFGVVIYVDYLLGIIRNDAGSPLSERLAARASLRKVVALCLVGFPLFFGYLIFSFQ